MLQVFDIWNNTQDLDPSSASVKLESVEHQLSWIYSLCSNREILTETLAAHEEYYRDKWTLFGNEAEKMEIAVIKNQRMLRKRVDKLALRKQVRVQNLPQKWPRTRLALPFSTFKSQSALFIQFAIFSLVSVFFFSTWPVKHLTKIAE